MIKYNPKTWFGQIFRVAKSDTLSILWKELIILAIFSSGLTYASIHYFGDTKILKDTVAVYSLIGFVLSLLLVFRTNTAYDRWWEGRKKWGELVNTSRNLAIKIASITDQLEAKDLFKRMIPNYALALKEHLRSGVKVSLLDLNDRELDEISEFTHKPNYIAKSMYHQLDNMKKAGTITELEFLSLDNNLQQFSEIAGACERIRNTPMPFSYNIFLKKFIFIYVTTLPLAFVNTFGYGTVLIAVFIFYVLVSIEILAEEIEDPFGEDDNDLPLDELSVKIKGNVEEILNA